MKATTRRLAILITFALSVQASVVAQENDRFARVVLFVESDAEIPENYDARLASLALRTEAFLGQWMTHWKRPIERAQIFARKDNGSIEVSIVKGKLLNPKGKAALPEIRKKAIEGASSQLKLPAQGGAPVIWWIFYDYPDVKGFQGGARGTGGVAINAYPKGDELIDLKAELAAEKMNDMLIKGTIHEFGHALGLPHIGPRPDVKLGNSLMGPINRVFWQKNSTDDARVYLTEASAAALWKHPIFEKKKVPNPSMPAEVSVNDLTFKEDAEGQRILITGKLSTKNTAHSVIAYDSERGKFGDYWARTYVAPVDPETGAFEIALTAPFQKGTVHLSFNFGSGINSADGKKLFQQGGPVAFQYSGQAGERKFQSGSE